MSLSYDTLRLEACWRAQFTPPALLWLAEQLRAFYGQGADEIGSPGDNRHVSGGHRSRRWLLTSKWAENPGYTTTHPDDRLGDEDWYCAIDINPGSQAELIAMCRRLDAAVRAGELEECWEWYGNLGGDTRVDGWNNLENRLATSDSSHLSHLHKTFRRRYANDMSVMRRALAILTGDEITMQLYRVKGDPKVWAYDGCGRRWVPDPAALTRLQTATGATRIVDLVSQADLDLIAPLPPAAVPPALAARLDPILAAALDDGDVTVVMDEASRAELAAIKDSLAALPAAIVGEFAHELADGVTSGQV